MNRDVRTLDTLTARELEALKQKKVTVIGAGGLGGYVIEMLSRFGIGTIQVVDGDVFDETNLNRQLFSREDNLGISKAKEAKERVGRVHSGVHLEAVESRFTEENAEDLLRGSDVVMDCVDNIEARFVMADTCTKLKIPMVHGAVGAWHGQVMTVMPGDGHIEKLYGSRDREMTPVGAAAFIPANIASCQVAECLKLLTGKGTLLRDQLKFIDLLDNESFVIELKQEKDYE